MGVGVESSWPTFYISSNTAGAGNYRGHKDSVIRVNENISISSNIAILQRAVRVLIVVSDMDYMY